ncbi:MAG TPA: S-methyl-5-thioribose-1-phosphate isomerase [Verrucomicrobia bacterium]|nr:S-methyl-5-thioribose-1-phosphate isomerase [Verrucomicrobiales bacterium]HIL54599.1 S-methyl-5-thioribose-1-phosphate isomerase [Verrucomicrobiota bacterium]
MNVDGKAYRTVWTDNEISSFSVKIIDQKKLPFFFEVKELFSVSDVIRAIADMHVRGAGCIGVTAAYGMWLAAKESRGDSIQLQSFADALMCSRPTATNLAWAVERQLSVLINADPADWTEIALKEAELIADEDANWCRSIGENGKELLLDIAKNKSDDQTVNILTHCNAGWLAFSDWGSATAPIYAAHRDGLPIHVWVDETRPLNQGSRLTAWELGQEGVPHTVIADNVGGHLMNIGKVDIVITGTDRTTRYGDVANKIGTYLKALAAHDNGIPFYVALPSSTFDWTASEGGLGIPIEERNQDEVRRIEGLSAAGELIGIELAMPCVTYANYAFDITPSRLVTGLITERGVCDASEKGVMELFPDKKQLCSS